MAQVGSSADAEAGRQQPDSEGIGGVEGLEGQRTHEVQAREEGGGGGSRDVAAA